MPELSQVRILNPAPGSQAHLGYSHARRYVRQGRAEWVKGQPAIRFVEADHRHQSAERLAFRQQTAAAYDATGLATRSQIERLPTIGRDVSCLTTIRRRPCPPST